MDSNKIFKILKLFLSRYETSFTILHNKSDNYYLNIPITETNIKSEFFGAVQIKRSYVAVHLMPIYYYPELLDNISEELKNKMQGKSCFNFKEIDDTLFADLNSLIVICFDKYKKLKKV